MLIKAGVDLDIVKTITFMFFLGCIKELFLSAAVLTVLNSHHIKA